jgi:hypothetical protein
MQTDKLAEIYVGYSIFVFMVQPTRQGTTIEKDDHQEIDEEKELKQAQNNNSHDAPSCNFPPGLIPKFVQK